MLQKINQFVAAALSRSAWLTAMLALVPAIAVGWFIGLGVLAVVYVPGNLVLPLLLVTTLYHLAQTRRRFNPMLGLSIVLGIAAASFAVAFSVDLQFFNTGINPGKLFRKDYWGWARPALAALVATPWIYRFVSERQNERRGT